MATYGLLTEEVIIDLHNGDVPLIVLHIKCMDVFRQLYLRFLADLRQLYDHADQKLDGLRSKLNLWDNWLLCQM